MLPGVLIDDFLLWQALFEITMTNTVVAPTVVQGQWDRSDQDSDRGAEGNSHMERQIGSTRRECLDWLLIINRRHLELVLSNWLEHHNQARPHRGLDLKTPIARSDPVVTSGPVTCDERLGGLLREYSREPAVAAAA